MYVNLHDLPPDRSMFTLYVAPRGVPFEQTEEYDIVGPSLAPDDVHLISLVIVESRDLLVSLYGPTVEVRGVIDQSAECILYDSRLRGFRPIPVVLPPRLAESFDPAYYDGRATVPYDAFIDLCLDAHDGMGTEQYLDFLTQEG